MFLDFSQNNMRILFEITEEKTVILKEFSVMLYEPQVKEKLQWCAITDIHITGENPDDHHGAKHTGSYGALNLKYNAHRYYKNEFGNRLEFDICDDKIVVTQHYQFYNGISVIRAWQR